MAETTKLSFSIDDYFHSSNIGSIQRAISNNSYGLNATQVPGAVPRNRVTQGYVFFTRPQLNLQADNLRSDRHFYRLLTEDYLSVPRSIRALLDPRICLGYNFKTNSIPPLHAPLIDNELAFIPWLTNNLINLSGWPDSTLPTFTSEPGMFNEVYFQVDGLLDNYEQYDLQATFANIRGGPILGLFYYWMRYAQNVFSGKFTPYLDYIMKNRLDYNTRAYRLIMDQNKKYVDQIMIAPVCVPIGINMGGLGDISEDLVFNDQVKEISTTIRCIGFETLDDIHVKEFNAAVQAFNAAMRDQHRDSAMTKVTRDILFLFNHRVYPRINPKTYELEWWSKKEVYKRRTASFLASTVDPNNTDPNIFGD